MGEEEGKKVKLDEYGQLAIGYELSKARAWVPDHAQKNLPAHYPWLQGLELDWEIASARFMEDQDAYEVLVAGYPEGAEVQQKGEWLYHVDVKGQLMPGTPVLRQVGKWGPVAIVMPPNWGAQEVSATGSTTLVPTPRPLGKLGWVVYVDHPTNHVTAHREACRYYERRKADVADTGYWSGPFATYPDAAEFARASGKAKVADCKFCRPKDWFAPEGSKGVGA